eukprot:scaffold528_cov165-Amphora_coffeaeformis.AAC.31
MASSLDDSATTKGIDDMPTHYAANVEFGRDYTRISVRNIEDLPSVVNDIVDAKRRMLADEAKFAKAKTESDTALREPQGMENADKQQLDDEMQSIPCSKRRKRKRDYETGSIQLQDTLVGEQSDRVLLLEANDPLKSLGWKTIDCGMWDQTKGEFPDASFMKNSCLGEQCPRSDMFHLLPETYTMGEGWMYKYTKCGCAFNETPFSAVARLVLPARQDDTDIKCYFVQVATEDLEQDYCQHEGDDGELILFPVVSLPWNVSESRTTSRVVRRNDRMQPFVSWSMQSLFAPPSGRWLQVIWRDDETLMHWHLSEFFQADGLSVSKFSDILVALWSSRCSFGCLGRHEWQNTISFIRVHLPETRGFTLDQIEQTSLSHANKRNNVRTTASSRHGRKQRRRMYQGQPGYNVSLIRPLRKPNQRSPRMQNINSDDLSRVSSNSNQPNIAVRVVLVHRVFFQSAVRKPRMGPKVFKNAFPLIDPISLHRLVTIVSSSSAARVSTTIIVTAAAAVTCSKRQNVSKNNRPSNCTWGWGAVELGRKLVQPCRNSLGTCSFFFSCDKGHCFSSLCLPLTSPSLVSLTLVEGTGTCCFHQSTEVAQQGNRRKPPPNSNEKNTSSSPYESCSSEHINVFEGSKIQTVDSASPSRHASTGQVFCNIRAFQCKLPCAIRADRVIRLQTRSSRSFKNHHRASSTFLLAKSCGRYSRCFSGMSSVGPFSRQFPFPQIIQFNTYHHRGHHRIHL